MIYALLFIGLIFGGETILLPALYFALEGGLNVSAVVFISLLATAISDSLWYLAGRFAPQEKIMSLPAMRRNEKLFERIREFFDAHAMRVIFLSKFVYGTRIAIQITSGIRRVYYPYYLAATLAGVAALNAVFLLIILLVNASLGTFREHTYYAQISLSVIIVIVVLLYYFLRRVGYSIWFR